MFGRFVPDFGRVVAQMQFDMYHHYTVDEHSIRAIGLLAAIERGELKQDHPLSTAIMQKQIASRRVLYVAVLLHDIAKGRGGDHSELGAEIALKLCPRFGLDRGRDRDRVLAGPLPPPAVVDRVQARPRRSQDDRGFRPSGAKPRAAAAAADPDGRRHPRRRARHLERVEADAASDLVRSGRGAACGSGTSSMAGASSSRSGRRTWPQSSAGKRARREPTPSACPTATGWPSRRPGSSPMPARSPPPKRISAMPRRTSSSRRIPRAARPGSACSRPTARPCSTASARGLRRPAPTSSTRAFTLRATAWRSTICWCSTAAAKPMPTGGLRARLAKAVEAALSSRGRRRLPSAETQRRTRGIRGRAVGCDRRPRVDPNHGGRSQCARSAGVARRACRRHPRRRAIDDPFGAHRDLRRASRRRLLRDACATGRSSTRSEIEELRAALLEAAREPREAKAA